jgi:hypothetical protein
MAQEETPVQDPGEIVDRPASLRFRIIFTIVILAIAVGYTWVWQVKTSRTVAEAPPDFILNDVTSVVPGHGPAEETALRDEFADRLRSVPRLLLIGSLSDVVLPTDGRLPPPVYALDGVLDRAADGGYEFEVRRSNARTDSTVYIYRVRGSTLPEVAHRMAVQVAMNFGLPLPARDDGASLPARDDDDSSQAGDTLLSREPPRASTR